MRNMLRDLNEDERDYDDDDNLLKVKGEFDFGKL